MTKNKVDVFDAHTSSKVRKRELLTKSREELLEDQKQRDKKYLKKIDKALADGIIDEKGADYLRGFYQDTAYVYTKLFRLLRKAFGKEFELSIVDPDTKKPIVPHPIAHYRHILPDNCCVMMLASGSHNPFYLTLPGLKNIDRAIDKLRKDGKYGGDHTKLKDLLRITISGKRLEDLDEAVKVLSGMEKVTFDKDSSKNRFGYNNIDTLYKSQEKAFLEKGEKSKNFRNIVEYMIMENGLPVEIQLKVTSLDKVDALTHGYYEDLRVILEDPSVSAEKKQLEKLKLEKSILQLNRWAIEKHNQNEILEKVVRMEEENEIMGYARDKDGYFPECIEFIQKNFLVRPHQILNLDDPLPNLPQDLKKSLGLDKRDDNDPIKQLFRDSTPELLAIFEKYKPFIKPKYINCLTESELTSSSKKTSIVKGASSDEKAINNFNSLNKLSGQRSV